MNDDSSDDEDVPSNPPSIAELDALSPVMAIQRSRSLPDKHPGESDSDDEDDEYITMDTTLLRTRSANSRMPTGHLTTVNKT